MPRRLSGASARGRERLLEGILAPLYKRHAASEMARVTECLKVCLGELQARDLHPKQRRPFLQRLSAPFAHYRATPDAQAQHAPRHYSDRAPVRPRNFFAQAPTDQGASARPRVRGEAAPVRGHALSLTGSSARLRWKRRVGAAAHLTIAKRLRHRIQFAEFGGNPAGSAARSNTVAQ